MAFLAGEIAETSRLTRELTGAAGRAIAALAGHEADPATRDALRSLMMALQAQDRVEQRLDRLEAFARAIDPARTAAHDALRRALGLDELVRSFERHMGAGRVPAAAAETEIELF
jgi:hypothetical protein